MSKEYTRVEAIDDIERQYLYTNVLSKKNPDKLYCYLIERIVELTNRIHELENKPDEELAPAGLTEDGVLRIDE